MPKTLPFNHPTTVGTEWVYKTPRGTVTLVLAKVEEKTDGKLVTLSFLNEEGEQRSTFQRLLLNHNGWFLVEEGSAVYDLPRCLLKLPHVEGQTWEMDRFGDGQLAVTGRAQAATVIPVKPPGAQIKAEIRWKYSVTSRGESSTHEKTCWYADGVGLVEMQDGLTKIWTLKSFTPGKE